nr:MAG TPA: hypothetical protein [Caudoviricetes sp.]
MAKVIQLLALTEQTTLMKWRARRQFGQQEQIMLI